MYPYELEDEIHEIIIIHIFFFLQNALYIHNIMKQIINCQTCRESVVDANRMHGKEAMCIISLILSLLFILFFDICVSNARKKDDGRYLAHSFTLSLGPSLQAYIIEMLSWRR